MQSDVDFHFTIAQIPRNRMITAALCVGMAEWLAEQRLISTHARGSVQAALETHARIFTAIVAHDAVAAGHAVREHLAEVKTSYWSARDDAFDGLDLSNGLAVEGA